MGAAKAACQKEGSPDTNAPGQSRGVFVSGLPSFWRPGVAGSPTLAIVQTFMPFMCLMV